MNTPINYISKFARTNPNKKLGKLFDLFCNVPENFISEESLSDVCKKSFNKMYVTLCKA